MQHLRQVAFWDLSHHALEVVSLQTLSAAPHTASDLPEGNVVFLCAWLFSPKRWVIRRLPSLIMFIAFPRQEAISTSCALLKISLDIWCLWNWSFEISIFFSSPRLLTQLRMPPVRKTFNFFPFFLLPPQDFSKIWNSIVVRMEASFESKWFCH